MRRLFRGFPTSSIVAVLGLFPVAAQEPSSLDGLRALVARGWSALAARPPAFDDALAAAITAELARPDVAARRDPAFSALLVELAELGVDAGRSAQAVGWLQPFDAASATDEDPAVRHRLAAALGLALRGTRQAEAARLRLQPAHDELAARVAPADPLLQSVRRQLASALASAVRWRECLPLALTLVEVDRSTNTATARLVEDLRLVGRSYHGLGRRQEAYDTFEQALQLARGELAPDDDRVLTAMADFAAATTQLGDYRGSFEIYREVLAVREQADVPDRHAIRHLKQQMSQLLVQLDNLQEACDLQEDVLLAFAADPERDEYQYSLGLLNYARNLYLLHRLDESHAAALDALARFAATVPDEHRDLGLVRALLGVLERRRGDLVASRRYLEAAWSGLLKSQGGDHTFTQSACGDLISTCRLQGDVARAAELAMTLLDASIAAVRDSQLAARQTARLASVQGIGVEHGISIVLDPGDPALLQQLARRSLLAVQFMRGASVHAGRTVNRRRLEAGAQLARLEADIASAIRRGDDGTLAALVRAKEAAERDELAAARPPLPDLDAMAKALPPDAIAAATVPVNRRFIRAPGVEPLSAADRMVVLVLSPDGSVRAVDLCHRDDLLDLGDALSLTPNVASIQKKLRSVVLDPIRAVAPQARVLYLALDDILLSVPWDSLPLASGAMVASELEVRRVTSLVDLVPAETPVAPPAAAAARLLVVGDVDFGSAPSPDRAAGASAARAGGVFVALPQSADEVAAVERSFARVFPQAPVTRLLRGEVTKDALQSAVKGASVVHLATHGCYDTDSVQRRTAALGGADVASTSLELAPFSLSGIALSGANQGVDAQGRLPGIVTAAELQRFDFGACYVVVVSACESGLGAASRGQGLASLSDALHIAGARYVVAALWPVSDAGSRHFAAAFHEALWQQPDNPHRALRLAKEASVQAGLPFADWAAFQLTGN